MRSEQTSAITISTKLFPTREKKAVGAVTCTPVSLPSTPLRSPPLRSVPLPSPAPRAKTTFTTDVPFRGVHRRSDLDEGTSCPPRRCLARFRLTPTFLETPSCKFYSAVLSRPCNLRPPRKNGRSDGRPPFHSCARVYVDARMRACAKLSLDSFVRVGRTLCRIPALLYTYVREI